MEPVNVVSLLPATTEVCYALGCPPAGVSHECDFPPAAADRPAVTRTAVDDAGDCAAVTESIESATGAGPVIEVDRARLAAADPDLVIAQATCEICAADPGHVEGAIADIEAAPDMLTVDPHSLADVYETIDRIGVALGRERSADRLHDRLHERVRSIETAVPATPRPTVVVLDWLDPVMVAGHWIPDLVERAGGRYPLAETGDPSRVHGWERIRECDPDVLIAAPCGFGVDRARSATTALRDRDGWDDLTAVRQGRAYAMDGDGLVNRPGPRLVTTLAALAPACHPSADLADPPADSLCRVATPLADASGSP